MAYNSADRAIALAQLETNNGNVKKTSKELEIGEATLREWRDAENRDIKNPIAQEASELLPKAKQILKEQLALAAEKLVASLQNDDKIDKANLKDISVSLGVVIDKLQLLSGEATSRQDLNVVSATTLDQRIEELANELRERSTTTG